MRSWRCSGGWFGRVERPNVEAADCDDSRRPTALVIRALGMIVGKLVRDGGGHWVEYAVGVEQWFDLYV